MENLEEFVAVSLLSLEMGMDRQGAVGKEQHVAWKVSVAETPSLVIKESFI